METETIYSIFSRNWVFKLYLQKKPSYLMVLILAAFLPLIIGALFAWILGVFPLYAKNIITYSGPLWIILSFSAFYWFAKNFPKKLTFLIPALVIDDETLLRTIQKWAKKLANRIDLMIVAGIPIATLSVLDVLSLWTNPTQQWIGSAWVESSRPVFFAGVYIFYYVIVLGFLIGSGIIGILGVTFLINELLNSQIKLDYYRRLRSVTELSTGIGLWTFAAFTIMIISSHFVKPLVNPNLVINSFILSVIGSLMLLIAFLAPMYPCYRAITRTKNQKIEIFEARLNEVANEIESLVIERTSQKLTESSKELLEENLAKEKLLLDERETIQRNIKEIEDIPDWPITTGRFFQIFSASILAPLFGEIPSFVASKFIDVIKTK